MADKTRKTLVALLQKHSKGGTILRRDVLRISKENGYEPPAWLMNGEKFRLDRGVIDLNLVEEVDLDESGRRQSSGVSPIRQRHVPATISPVILPMSSAMVPIESLPDQKILRQAKVLVEVGNLVPERDDTFVPFGFYRDLITILSGGRFYPVFISGLSGNGKTTMVEQACARLTREFIRVPISIETDEDDLIGGNTLVDGNVVYREGPVITGMRRGSVVCLDELDRGSNKLMCLQPILEGKPYYNKKTGEIIYPQPGFTIIATANTKGRGSEDGRFISAQILDDALLERFAVTVEQEYPSARIEKRILINKMHREGVVDEDFANKLVEWAEIIRKTFLEGGVTELVSTRRLEHIVRAYAQFRNRMKALNMCIARFDGDTIAAFKDLYTKVDASASTVSDDDTDDTED
jgi:MoxR-like ATPase